MAKCAVFNFRGIIATAFTPFKNDSAKSLNLSVIPQYAQYFSDKGFGAVLINGTYGEGMAMTTDERIQVAKAWSEAVKKTKQQLIVQVGGTNLQDVKKLAQHAQDVNANAILCLPELYYKPKTAEELIDYLKEVGAAAPLIPLFYYYSPIATGVTVNMNEFFEKVKEEIPSLAGIKFACTKLDDCTQALIRAGNRFKIILANNYILPASIAVGVDTFMPTSVNVAPELVQKTYDCAIEGDFGKAQEYQTQLTLVMSKLAKVHSAVIPAMKAVTSHLTPINVGSTRKPLTTFDTPVEQAQIELLAKELKPLTKLA